MKLFYFQVKITDGYNQTVLPWNRVADSSSVFSYINGLPLHAYSTYTVNLRAVNHGGYVSVPVKADFSVETSYPIFTGNYTSSGGYLCSSKNLAS